jgi:hypothetical protein
MKRVLAIKIRSRASVAIDADIGTPILTELKEWPIASAVAVPRVPATNMVNQ